MNPDSKTRLITIAEIGVLIAVLVVGLLIGWYFARRAPSSDLAPGANNASSSSQQSATVSDVPADTVVPEVGDAQSGDVAVPNSVVDAAPGVEAKSRSYVVTVNGDKFSPSTIAARVGDTISIRFTAEDKDYDYTQPDLGLSAKLLKGKEQLIQVSPSTVGRFTFFCASCGGPDKGPVGYLVVAPKQ